MHKPANEKSDLTPPPAVEMQPFLREIPETNAKNPDDCHSKSTVHFRILYLASAIIALLQVCSLIFIVQPNPTPKPIAPNPVIAQQKPDHHLIKLPRMYCTNGTLEMTIPLSSTRTDLSRFLTICEGDDAVVFCSELEDGKKVGLAFRCGDQIGGPILSIRQFIALMESISLCIDTCKATGKTPLTSTVDSLIYIMDHGVNLTIYRRTGKPRNLAINELIILGERDIYKLVKVADELKTQR